MQKIPGIAIHTAINEKVRNAKPSSFLSKTLHYIFGLDHYPNYLYRWNNIHDIEDVEKNLEDLLKKVRHQKEIVIQRNQFAKELPIKDSNMIPPIEIENVFTKEAIDILQLDKKLISPNSNQHINLGKIASFVTEEAPGIYSFPLFNVEFCKKMLTRSQQFLDYSKNYEVLDDKRPPDLDLMGFTWLNDALLQRVIQPLVSLLYFGQSDVNGELDWRQGYIAGYETTKIDGARIGLINHTDDSEITLNVGLGEFFNGGDLIFRGLRGTKDEDTVQLQYQPRIGKALLHVGRQLHEVQNVTSGKRFALILWCRSWEGTRSRLCPCCWMNRRETYTNDCVCGEIWN